MALQIPQWNCKSIQNKLAILLRYLTSFKILPDILCLQETHLNQNSSFLLPGYKLLRKIVRIVRKVAVFVFSIKNNLSISKVKIPASINDLEVTAITISGTLIINAYNSPSDLIDTEDLSFVKDFTNVVICGDLNAHHKM